jgi:hypothetical protein
MNNFDTCSKGESITLDIFHDSHLAQIYYDEFINGADGNPVTVLNTSHEASAYLIGDASKPFYSPAKLRKMTRKDLWKLAYDYDLIGGVSPAEYLKADLIDELKAVTIERHYEWLNSHYLWHEIKHHIPHNFYISRGYSQGDARYIVDVGADYDVMTSRARVDHVLWDCPISASLTIDGDEYTDDSLLNDCYEYDKSAVIEKVKALDISDYAKNWISENLPDAPRYD